MFFYEGFISDYDFETETATIVAPISLHEFELLQNQEITSCQLQFDDGRHISIDQRKKIYATFRDIADYTGHVPDEVKAIMKYEYIAKTGCAYFSLSNVDMTFASEFLQCLIEFCVEWDIPTADNLIERSPFVARTIYACFMNKQCCVCGNAINSVTHLHHEDHVGSKGNRREISHLGMKALPLCSIHHSEAHQLGKTAFNEKYHVFGIKIDKAIARKYKLKITEVK